MTVQKQEEEEVFDPLEEALSEFESLQAERRRRFANMRRIKAEIEQVADRLKYEGEFMEQDEINRARTKLGYLRDALAEAEIGVEECDSQAEVAAWRITVRLAEAA